MTTKSTASRGRSGATVQRCTVEILTRMLEENCSGGMTYESNRVSAFAEYTGALISDNKFGPVPELPIGCLVVAAERTPQRKVWLELRAAEGHSRLSIPEMISSGELRKSLRPLAIDDRADQPTIRIQIA